MEPQNRITYHIGRRAGKQGPRPSVGNQAEVEKSATGTDSSNQAHEVHNTEENTHRCPHDALSKIKQKATRMKWSKEEYTDVIEAHYRALLNPKISTTIDTYNIWREKRPTLRPNIDANKLANTRRDIIRKKRLTDNEMQMIKNRVSEEIGNVEQNHEENSQTDREIKANRPDIIVKDKKERTCQLIEISVPTERNTSIKTTEKLSKYKDLEIEIERMWGMNIMTIPIIIGALGLLKKGMEKCINKIPGNISIQETQKCVLLGTAHILRRILSIK